VPSSEKPPSEEKLRARIEEDLLALILRANRAGIYSTLLQSANVSIDKALYPVLSATAAVGPARVTEIAKLLTINPTTTSRHLTALEQKGLISREGSDTDGRAAVVQLTDAGRHAVSELRKGRKRLFAKLLADFDATELQRFSDYLDRVIRAFKEFA
jgi:DNA-binding MarR family transcriptional regulator